jgi:tetratricopeptide (TPR) repeat protein
LSGAIADFTEAIRYRPDSYDGYYNRGVAYLMQEDYPNALSDLNRTIELYPEMASAYHNRGNAYRGLKKSTESIADYTKAIEIHPFADVYYSRGIANEDVGHIDLALADYSRAIELNPKFARALINRGLLLLQQGKDIEAQRDLDAAFQLDGTLHSEFDDFIKNTRKARKKVRG